MSSVPALRVENLFIRRDKVPLIQGLSFQLDRGSILGVTSLNRLAVRSLILALAGHLPLDAGRIELSHLGVPLQTGRKAQVSSFFNTFDFPPKLRVMEVLTLHGGKGSPHPDRIKEVSELLRIDRALGIRLELLSGPMRSKARLASCLVRDDDYVVLDYLPSDVGEDCAGIVRNYLISMANLGKTIVAATDEPESFCDRVLLIRGPSSFEFGNPHAVRRRLLGPGRVELAVRGLDLQAVQDRLMKLGSSWIYTDGGRLIISCTNDKPQVEELVSEIADNGGVIEGIRTLTPRLLDATEG